MLLNLVFALSLGGCSSMGFGDSSSQFAAGASADTAASTACGPYAAIVAGRAWTWALTPSGDRNGTMTQTVTEFDGTRGVLQSVAEAGGATMHFRCDGGLVFDYIEYSLAGAPLATYYEDPQPSIPASIVVGDRWVVENKGTTKSAAGSNPFNYTVTSEVIAEESHSVMAGTWNAFRIRNTKDSGETTYTWVVSGVGVVEYSGAELADWSG